MSTPYAAGARKFRKKPVVISAVRWTGDNLAEMKANYFENFRVYVSRAGIPGSSIPDPAITGEIWDVLHSTWVGVKTGQWVIRGVQGETYPIDAEVLEQTYEDADVPVPDREDVRLIVDSMASVPLRDFTVEAFEAWERLRKCFPPALAEAGETP